MARKIDIRGWSLSSVVISGKTEAEVRALVAKKNKDNSDYEYVAVKSETRSKNTGKSEYSIYGRLAKPYYLTTI
jgi:hypothetical protein